MIISLGYGRANGTTESIKHARERNGKNAVVVKNLTKVSDILLLSQQAFTCSKLTIETLAQGVKYQS